MSRQDGLDRALEVLVAVGLGAATLRLIRGIAGRYRASQLDLQGRSLTRFRDLGNVPKAHLFEVGRLEDRIALLNELSVAGERDPKIIMMARKAVSKRCGEDWCIAEQDYEGEVVAVFEEARRQVRYVLDPQSADTFAHPRWTLEGAAGDCDDEAVILACMLGAIGYPRKWRAIQTTDAAAEGLDWDHIYLLVGLPPTAPSKWVALDLSEPHPPGWEVPEGEIARRADFDVA